MLHVEIRTIVCQRLDDHDSMAKGSGVFVGMATPLNAMVFGLATSRIQKRE